MGCQPPLDKDYSVEDVLQGAKSYFDKVFAPATIEEKQVVLKIRDLDLKCVAPGHGVILKEKLEDVLALYEKECAGTSEIR
ncbi:hypothetical protein SDC9_185147 [bioreactor metagenome]|uniref:Metallo-beta-lactamase domain-containing protein n=1 Tax=bioreactor metagenome TaxID=1076179 RepID=A0A645HF16_9ZZZZ